MLIGRLLALFLAALLWAASAGAHPAPGSTLQLDFGADAVVAELRLPLDQLEIATGMRLKAAPAEAVSRHEEALLGYIAKRLLVQAPDGRHWQVTLGEMRVALDDQPVDLVVQATMGPPEGAPLRLFRLEYDVIGREVPNHATLVSVRSDWQGGVFASEPELIGSLRFLDKSLVIDRSAGGEWQGFRAVFDLGMQHIAEGTDHLLFLLALLLPAPLLAAGKRWGGFGGVRHGAWQILRVVTAFTVGHSLTLVAAAVGGLRLPSAPVEVVIALSIVVSALHAWRPLFGGRETWVAAGFGLVHGLAFAAIVTDLGLDPWHMALGILGFNLGIEAMQLVVVAAAMPWLMMLSRTPAYAALRTILAAFAALAGLGWAAERALNLDNPFAVLIEDFAAHAPWLVAALAAAALLATAWERLAERSASS